MRSPRSILAPAAVVTTTLMVAMTTASPAVARGHSILREDLQGTFPLTAPVNPSPVIAGVNPGGAPWVVDEGSEARVREDGRIRVELQHLVIPNRVPGNPAPFMAASLVCDDMVVDSTRPFPVTEDGNGLIEDRISGTKDCDDPVVLVRSATNPEALGNYFAVAMED